MFCRIAMRISPPWSALPDRKERVTLRVTLSGGANVTSAIPVELRPAVSTKQLAVGDQRWPKTVLPWKLHERGCTVARQDGRRFLPPEELRIVPQPRRERPPMWPRRLTLGRDRGGRSRLGCQPRFRIRFGLAIRAGKRHGIAPRNTPLFHRSISGLGRSEISTWWGVRWL